MDEEFGAPESVRALAPTIDPPTPAAKKKKWRWPYLLTAVPIGISLVWASNYLLVSEYVDEAITSDARNSGYAMSGHFQFYLDSSELILDLRSVSAAAPLDLFRGLFQSAEALSKAGRQFDQVVLARAGTPVFLMSGQDFAKLGVEFGAGENPVYLIRTLPETLKNPSGEPAFGHWEGGMLGVLTKQMEDANRAGQKWAEGP